MKADCRLAAGTARIYFFFFYTQLPFRNGFSPVARCPACSLKRSEILCRENIDAVSGWMQFLFVQQTRRGASVFSSNVSFHMSFSSPMLAEQANSMWTFCPFFSCRRAIKILGVHVFF